jgi:hypothetical protein
LRWGANQRKPNGFEYALGVRKHLAIPESKHTKSDSSQPCGAALVLFGSYCVLRTIQLNDEAGRHAGEVGDIWSEWDLAPESELLELLASQQRPEFALGFGHVRAK